MIDQFLEHLTAEGKSANTIQAYRRDLCRLEEMSQVPISTMTPDGFSFLLARMRQNEGLSPSTVNRVLSSAKSFFRWAVEAEKINADPTVKVRTKRVEQAPPVYLDKAEKNRLLKELRMSKEPHALRDLAIFQLMLGTGIRLAEAVGLDVGDIDEKHITVTVKGGKVQKKFLASSVRDVLKRYLKERLSAADDSPAMFLGRNGRISHRQVQNRLDYWASRAGIQKQVTPHVLRHTFATELLTGTGNIYLVKEALGHASVETTAIYAHLSDSALESAIEAI